MGEMSTAYDFRGRTVVDREGEKIGKVDGLYYDAEGAQPEWALVNTGLFGTKKTLVPLRGASGEDVQAPVTKAQVKDAPRIDADQELSTTEERELFEHYGVAYTASAQGAPRSAAAGGADDAMTRSEEELHVGTERRETGNVRLRKYVVTEQVETTVPVQHEEVRIEREPITDANVDEALGGTFGVDGIKHALAGIENPTACSTAMAVLQGVTDCWREPLEDDGTVAVLAIN